MKYIEISFCIKNKDRLDGMEWIENLSFNGDGVGTCRIDINKALDKDIAHTINSRQLNRLKKILSTSAGMRSVKVRKISTTFNFDMEEGLSFVDYHGLFTILSKVFLEVVGSSSDIKVVQDLSSGKISSYTFTGASVRIDIYSLSKKMQEELSTKEYRKVTEKNLNIKRSIRIKTSRKVKLDLEDFSYESELRKSYGLLQKHVLNEDSFYSFMEKETNRLKKLLKRARKRSSFNHRVFLYETKPIAYDCLRGAIKECYPSIKSREAITTSFRKSIKNNKEFKHLLLIKPLKYLKEIKKLLKP